MDINGMGRMFDKIKIMRLESKWQQRKMDFIRAEPEKESYEKDSYISAFMKQNKEAQKALALQFITNKLKSGKRLSHSEMEFLKVHSPALYEKALKIEKEREEYRNALRNCKTKEEARRLQAEKSMQLQAEADAVSGKGKDADEKLEFIAMRVMAMLDEFAEFASSDEYRNLLNESDKDEENKEGKGKKRQGVFKNSDKTFSYKPPSFHVHINAKPSAQPSQQQSSRAQEAASR